MNRSEQEKEAFLESVRIPVGFQKGTCRDRATTVLGSR